MHEPCYILFQLPVVYTPSKPGALHCNYCVHKSHKFISRPLGLLAAKYQEAPSKFACLKTPCLKKKKKNTKTKEEERKKEILHPFPGSLVLQWWQCGAAPSTNQFQPGHSSEPLAFKRHTCASCFMFCFHFLFNYYLKLTIFFMPPPHFINENIKWFTV